MSETSETVNFDRAAEFYDSTRDVGDAAITDTIEHLATSLAGRGRVLEIGVGTGMLALPLAARGLDVDGIDVSTAMLAKLRQKASADGRVRVVEADARRLPFRDGTFGGAYLRHVFHLIPTWELAVAELCRVVGDGVILVDAGRRTPAFAELWRSMSPALGPEAEPPGHEAGRKRSASLRASPRSGTRQKVFPSRPPRDLAPAAISSKMESNNSFAGSSAVKTARSACAAAVSAISRRFALCDRPIQRLRSRARHLPPRGPCGRLPERPSARSACGQNQRWQQSLDPHLCAPCVRGTPWKPPMPLAASSGSIPKPNVTAPSAARQFETLNLPGRWVCTAMRRPRPTATKPTPLGSSAWRNNPHLNSKLKSFNCS